MRSRPCPWMRNGVDADVAKTGDGAGENKTCNWKTMPSFDLKQMHWVKFLCRAMAMLNTLVHGVFLFQQSSLHQRVCPVGARAQIASTRESAQLSIWRAQQSEREDGAPLQNPLSIDPSSLRRRRLLSPGSAVGVALAPHPRHFDKEQAPHKSPVPQSNPTL